MHFKKKNSLLLALPLMLSAFASHANIDHMYINGPKYLERLNWDAEYSLQEKGDYNGEITWLLAEKRVFQEHYLKVNGDTAITGFSMGWLPHTSLLQAVVLDNGEYKAITKKFCQDGYVLGCAPLTSKRNFSKGELVKIDFNFMPTASERHIDDLTTEWNFTDETADLLKGTKINKTKFSLSFTVPELKESTKVTFYNRVKTSAGTNVVLKRDICLRGADMGVCSGMNNTFNVGYNATRYDYLGVAENIGKFQKGDMVIDAGITYTCVEQAKCNNQDYTPVIGSSKWRAAWIQTFL